jgi:predicted  nucleic acid-binding Zn-ribbon protein
VHHGDLYDYTDVTHCEDQSTKVTVVCQTHGPWTSSWASHIQYKRGCPTCGSNQQLLSRDSQAVESFVTKSQAIHGVKYDYTNTTRQVNLEGSRYNYLFSVMCPEHGEWWTRSKHHFRKDPSGCPKCGIRKPAKTTESWIAAAISVHGNKYTYERAEFGDGLSKIIVTCPTHGDFEVYPYRFTNKHKTGCAGCAQKAQHTRSSFVTKATTVHFGKYDYSLVGEFANIKSKIQVVCPKHGAFTTTVQQHANSLVGCKKCKESRGEAIISHILKLKSINFIQEHRFGDCRNPMTNK